LTDLLFAGSGFAIVDQRGIRDVSRPNARASNLDSRCQWIRGCFCRRFLSDNVMLAGGGRPIFFCAQHAVVRGRTRIWIEQWSTQLGRTSLIELEPVRVRSCWKMIEIGRALLERIEGILGRTWRTEGLRHIVGMCIQYTVYLTTSKHWCRKVRSSFLSEVSEPYWIQSFVRKPVFRSILSQFSRTVLEGDDIRCM
jgi:hypothetical protein